MITMITSGSKYEMLRYGIISSDTVNTGKENSAVLHIYLSGGTFR